MKFSNLITHLATMSLTAATAAAGASLPPRQSAADGGKSYNLRLVGGTQQLNHALLTASGTSSSINLIFVPSSTSSNATAPAVVLPPLPSASSPGPILVSTTSAEPTNLILQGPSGKGEYSLRISTDTTPFGIGSQILWDAFWVLDVGTRKYLRYKDDTNSYHWVAETETGRVWWSAPSEANVGDVEGWAVDVEVVEA